MRRRGGAFASLTSAVILAGCGNLGTGERTERVDQPQLVRRADLARHQEGSPARAFLEWWRALQFGSATQAVRHYASDARVSRRKLQRQLRVEPELLGLTARPKVLDVVGEGGKATVFALFTRARVNPNGRIDRERTPRAFDLVREEGEWKIADNRYIERTLRTLSAFFRGGADRRRPGSDRGQ